MSINVVDPGSYIRSPLVAWTLSAPIMRPRGNWCRPDTALLNAALSNGNGAAILETALQRARNEREIREQGGRERARPG